MSVLLLDISLDWEKYCFNIDKTVSLFYIQYKTSDKFTKDKLKFENEYYYLILDGIVLNKDQLLKEVHCENWGAFLVDCYEKNGNAFFKVLKGSYYGFLFDKRQNKYIIFTDHIGTKPLYYSIDENHIIVSNHYLSLVNYLKENGKRLTLNEHAAYLILTYGYVYEDVTITNEINRMMIGQYAVIQNATMNIEKFYCLKNDPISITEEEAIEELDRQFRKTVDLAFSKDVEYGYKHVVTLSGGLDSRMTAFVAHDIGYKEQLNLTFSQSNYLDETVAKQISSDLKHDWIFKTLDSGNFLFDIDIITEITGGNVLYYGLAHANSLYKRLNFKDLGVLHTGQLGDVIVSSFCKTINSQQDFSSSQIAYSPILLKKIKDIPPKIEYPNEEIYKMYIRGFYGANQGLLGTMNYTETYSPFYDIDFMDFCLSIPLNIRLKHNLYKKWILKKYPEAAKYTWEKEKVPINYKFWVKFKNRSIPLKEIPNKIKSLIGQKKYGPTTKNNMNPLEYWYHTNRDLELFMDSYLYQTINTIEDHPDLVSSCMKIYQESKASEKVQVLSLLAGIKAIMQ